MATRKPVKKTKAKKASKAPRAKRAKKSTRAKRVVKKESPVPEAEQGPKNGAGIPEEMDFFYEGGMADV